VKGKELLAGFGALGCPMGQPLGPLDFGAALEYWAEK